MALHTYLGETDKRGFNINESNISTLLNKGYCIVFAYLFLIYSKNIMTLKYKGFTAIQFFKRIQV